MKWRRREECEWDVCDACNECVRCLQCPWHNHSPWRSLANLHFPHAQDHFSREICLVTCNTVCVLACEWWCVEPYHIRFGCGRGWKLVLLRSKTQVSLLVSHGTLWVLMWLVPGCSLIPCCNSGRSRQVPVVAPTSRLLCCLFWEVEE